MVALHIALIDSKIVEVDEDAVEQDDPYGRASKVESGAPEAELPGLGGNLEQLARALRHAHDEEADDEERTDGQDDTLDRIGPNNGFDAPDERIDRDEGAHADDDGRNRPTREYRDGQANPKEYRADTCELGQEVTHQGVGARPAAKAPL